MTRPTTMRRAVSDADKEQRRRDLLAAAKRLFAERGFPATTIADIARAAGVSYGVVYWYFESKDDLFHALMAEEEAALRARIIDSVVDSVVDSVDDSVDGAPDADARTGEGAADLRAALRDAVQATFEYFEDDRASAALLFRDSLTLSDDFERHLFGIYGRFTDELEGAFRDAQHAGLARRTPPHLVAFSAAALISQMALRRLTVDDGLTAAEAAAFTVDLLMDGLRPR